MSALRQEPLFADAQNAESPLITRALVIREPAAGWIVSGAKRWEMRSKSTRIRGNIGIIAGGTGTVIGVCDLNRVVGPLRLQDYRESHVCRGPAATGSDSLPYKRTFAWVMENPRQLERPIPYIHPKGAVIWVRVSSDVQEAIRDQLSQGIVSDNARDL